VKPLYKGLLIALFHILIVSSLGAKLLYDRGHRPRAWIKVVPVDPNLPIRGRYLALRLQIPGEGFVVKAMPPVENDKAGKPIPREFVTPNRCDLLLRDGQLIASANENSGEFWCNTVHSDGSFVSSLMEETAYFIPEHIPDPSRRPAGEELWIEATIPRKGPPRPIRLGVKKDGVLTPLAID
jgi:hypothetical protein